MADIITVINFTENTQSVYLMDSNNNPIASGSLGAGQTSGFQVPNNEELYNVYFQPQASSGYLTAANVAPNSQVGVSMTGGGEED